MSAFEEHIRENAGAWLLFGALLVVGYWWRSALGDFHEACDLAEPAAEIVTPAPLDETGKPISPTDFKAMMANIRRLRTEHSVDGELWRWQKFEGEKLATLCTPHESDEDSR